MLQGRIVPSEWTISLLHDAIVKAVTLSDKPNPILLIDGFPRNMDNYIQWFQYVDRIADTIKISLVNVIVLDCDLETIESRLINRTGNRLDDNIETIRLRYSCHVCETLPVLEAFPHSVVIHANGRNTPDDVHATIMSHLRLPQ